MRRLAAAVILAAAVLTAGCVSLPIETEQYDDIGGAYASFTERGLTNTAVWVVWANTNAPPLPTPDPVPPVGEREYVYFDNARCAGYGAVNYWHTLPAAEQAAAISDAGLDVYHIELLGWADARISPEAARQPYLDLLAECRQRKVVLFTSIFNDNSHLSKYGNTPRAPSLSTLMQSLVYILEAGPEGQIVQPVGETQTSTGKQFETAAGAALRQAGFKTCWNSGSRPSSPPSGWDYAAYHPTSTGKVIPKGAACVTDTGAILVQLGGYAQFNAAAVESYGRQCLDEWKRPCILYGFQHKAIDIDAAQALGRVKRQ